MLIKIKNMVTPKTNTFIFKILSIFLINLHSVLGNDGCIVLDVSISQKVERLGFHRDIKWLVSTKTFDKGIWTNTSCQVALMLEIPQEIYVNPDQVEDLKRLGKLDIFVDGIVNIELPAHEATKHTVYIYLNSSKINEIISLTLPIHLRYQRSLMGGYGKAVLNKPSLLVYCPKSNDIICGEESKVNAPINSVNFTSVKVWKNITYQADFDDLEFLVPIGDLNHYPYVAVTTCILGCVGCIYILSLFSN